MQPDRKVYDSDLRLTPLLREIAHTYAREYIGNFDMMIEARQYMIEEGVLAEGMYRPVLNTLRTDVLRPDLWAAASALLHTPREAPPTLPPDGLAEVVGIGRGRRSERRFKEHERHWKVQSRTTCKAPLATTKTMAAKPVVHLIRSDSSVVWWLPRLDNGELDRRPGVQRIPEFAIKTFCKGYGFRGNFWFEVPTYDMAFPDKWEDGDVLMPFCRACVFNSAEQSEFMIWKGEVS